MDTEKELNTDNTQAIVEHESKVQLQEESSSLIDKIVKEHDVNKSDELVKIFNFNQKKRTMVRVNKLNDLMDLITDQTFDRLSKKSDEVTTTEILQALKTTQDALEKSQKHLSDKEELPLIQINQQNNDINLTNETTLSRESRNRVKNVVDGILAEYAKMDAQADTSSVSEVVEAEFNDNDEVKGD